jgi:dipeptidase
MLKQNKFPKSLAFILTLVFAAPLVSVNAGEGCFTIVVGKDASVDGGVIMAHNEDDAAPQLVNHHKIPRIKHRSGEKVRLDNGGELDQVEETWAYIWSEMPAMRFSDSYVNEWGVAITSNNCPSREDTPELVDGGIGRNLRSLVVQRAKSAREGVLLAGELVERFGYDASGRTYTICDRDEGWMFCAVNGKHWLAHRVPDHQVAMIANTYTVQAVDLTDSLNTLASSDIVDYAISRGWYDPEGNHAFNFAAAYANPRADLDSSNFCRWWSGLRYVVADALPLERELPFSVKPWHKLDVAAVQSILRDHFGGTVLYQTSSETGSPHESYLHTICGWTTQTSFVLQLRRELPADFGICYWVCLGPPCTSPYIPFYFGMSDFPGGFVSAGQRPAEDVYRQYVSSPFEIKPLQAFYMFSNFHDKIDSKYGTMIADVQASIKEMESRTLIMQGSFELTVAQSYMTDSSAIAEVLSNYSRGIYLSAIEMMHGIMAKGHAH